MGVQVRASTFKHQDDLRRKISAAMIIKHLGEHVHGKREMLPTQVQAAKILLNKVIPDLQSIQGPGTDGAHRFELIAPWLTAKIATHNG